MSAIALSPCAWTQHAWYSSLLSSSSRLAVFTPESAGSVAVGAGVATYNNLVTGGVDGAQATGAKQPLRTADGISFDGAAQYLELAGLTSASTDYTITVVMTPDDVAGTQTILGCDTSESFSHVVSGNVAANDGTGALTGMVATARLQILTIVVKASGTLAEFYRDGKKLASLSSYDGTWSWGATPILGAAFGGASGFFDGTIHAMLLDDAALSASELSADWAVLKARFGVAATLESIADFEVAYIGSANKTGDPVSAWAPYLGTGSDFTQSTAAERPDDIGTEIACDGVDDHLDYSGAKADWNHLHDGTGVTLVMRYRCPTIGLGVFIGSCASASTANVGLEMFAVNSSGNGRLRVTDGSGIGYVVDAAPGNVFASDGSAETVTYRMESAYGFDWRVAGASVASGALLRAASAADSTADTQLAARAPGNSVPLNLVLGVVAKYGRALNDLETAAAESIVEAMAS